MSSNKQLSELLKGAKGVAELAKSVQSHKQLVSLLKIAMMASELVEDMSQLMIGLIKVRLRLPLP